MVHCLLFQFSYNTLNTCLYHWVRKAWPGVSKVTQGYPITCQVCSGLGTYLGICSQEAATQPSAASVLFLLADRTVLLGILCIRVYKKSVSRLSQSHIAALTPYPLTSWMQVAVSGEHRGISACDSIHLPSLERSSSDGHQHVLL